MRSQRTDLEQGQVEATVLRLLRERAPYVLGGFPCWAVTNLSIGSRLPLIPALFDLAIIDEASQSDIPSAIPVLFRAKRVGAVGDPAQLSPITKLSTARDTLLRREVGLNSMRDVRFAYSENSFYNIVAGTNGVKPIFLSDTYRSADAIAAYSSEVFYGGNLRVATNKSSLNAPKGIEPGIHWTEVQGSIESGGGSGCYCTAEIETVVCLLRGMLGDPWAQNRMLLVLLDEMNLARTEYYFSEFLSKLELRRLVKDADKPVDRKDAEIELDVGPGKGVRFPLWVGPNVLFVGTMNEDETTQTLSDKVLDRSNVLRFGKPSDTKAHQDGCDTLNIPLSEKFLSWERWKSWSAPKIVRRDGASVRLMKIDQDGRAGSPEGQAVVAKLQDKLEEDFSQSQLAQYRDKIITMGTWLWGGTPSVIFKFLENYFGKHFTRWDCQWNYFAEAASRCFSEDRQYKILFCSIYDRVIKDTAESTFPINAARSIYRVLNYRENSQEALTQEQADAFLEQALKKIDSEIRSINLKRTFFQGVLLFLALLRYRKINQKFMQRQQRQAARFDERRLAAGVEPLHVLSGDVGIGADVDDIDARRTLGLQVSDGAGDNAAGYHGLLPPAGHR